MRSLFCCRLNIYREIHSDWFPLCGDMIHFVLIPTYVSSGGSHLAVNQHWLWVYLECASSRDVHASTYSFQCWWRKLYVPSVPLIRREGLYYEFASHWPMKTGVCLHLWLCLWVFQLSTSSCCNHSGVMLTCNHHAPLDELCISALHHSYLPLGFKEYSKFKVQSSNWYFSYLESILKFLLN